MIQGTLDSGERLTMSRTGYGVHDEMRVYPAARRRSCARTSASGESNSARRPLRMERRPLLERAPPRKLATHLLDLGDRDERDVTEKQEEEKEEEAERSAQDRPVDEGRGV